MPSYLAEENSDPLWRKVHPQHASKDSYKYIFKYYVKHIAFYITRHTIKYHFMSKNKKIYSEHTGV